MKSMVLIPMHPCPNPVKSIAFVARDRFVSFHSAVPVSTPNSTLPTKPFETTSTPTNGRYLHVHSSLHQVPPRLWDETFDQSATFIGQWINSKVWTDRGFRNPRTLSTLSFSPQIEPVTSNSVKAERDQEIQKFYRAELIQHLINWPSTQSEKQVTASIDRSIRTAIAFVSSVWNSSMNITVTVPRYPPHLPNWKPSNPIFAWSISNEMCSLTSKRLDFLENPLSYDSLNRLFRYQQLTKEREDDKGSWRNSTLGVLVRRRDDAIEFHPSIYKYIYIFSLSLFLCSLMSDNHQY